MPRTATDISAMLIMMPKTKDEFHKIHSTLSELDIKTVDEAEASGLLTKHDLILLRMGLAQMQTHGHLLDMEDLAQFALAKTDV